MPSQIYFKGKHFRGVTFLRILQVVLSFTKLNPREKSPFSDSRNQVPMKKNFSTDSQNPVGRNFCTYYYSLLNLVKIQTKR